MTASSIIKKAQEQLAKVRATYMLPASQVEFITDYANQKGVTMSVVAEALIAEGIAAIREHDKKMRRARG